MPNFFFLFWASHIQSSLSFPWAQDHSSTVCSASLNVCWPWSSSQNQWLHMMLPHFLCCPLCVCGNAEVYTVVFGGAYLAMWICSSLLSYLAVPQCLQSSGLISNDFRLSSTHLHHRAKEQPLPSPRQEHACIPVTIQSPLHEMILIR